MTRIICMLVYPQAQSLDISGPLEVFALASRQAQDNEPTRGPLYSVCLLAATAAPVEVASGMRLLPDATYSDMPPETDTLLVCGGMGDAMDRVRADTALVTWLREASSRVRRVASICSGALLLAEAGLLDDREATTHWSDVPELRDRYPAVRVLPDAIYTRDGPVWTSAGITTGMDLALQARCRLTRRARAHGASTVHPPLRRTFSPYAAEVRRATARGSGQAASREHREGHQAYRHGVRFPFRRSDATCLPPPARSSPERLPGALRVHVTVPAGSMSVSVAAVALRSGTSRPGDLPCVVI